MLRMHFASKNNSIELILSHMTHLFRYIYQPDILAYSLFLSP